MSALTAYNVARFLSRETREQVSEILPPGWAAGFASNVESALRARGEHAIARRMLSEIDQALANDKEAAGPERENERILDAERRAVSR